MSGLLIVGAGGHGKVVADAALVRGSWEEIAFVDDRAIEIQSVLSLQVLGTTALLSGLRGRFSAAIVAIGGASERIRLLEHCRTLGFELPPVVHPSATVSRFASLEVGCVVCAQAVVNPGSRLGAGCIVNTAASVDHDCELGSGVHVCPGARLAGNVRVGNRTWIGIASCVRQGVEIGSDVMVAAGSVVVADVTSGLTIMGVPARPKEESK